MNFIDNSDSILYYTLIEGMFNKVSHITGEGNSIFLPA